MIGVNGRRMVAVLATVCLLAATAAAVFAASQRPRPVTVRAGQHSVKAAKGSSCISHSSGGGTVQACADSAYPLKPHGKLPVTPRRVVKLRMHDGTIATLKAQLIRVRGNQIKIVGQATGEHRVKSHPTRWRARLPKHLRHANILDIFIKYKNGLDDADYWARIDSDG